MWVGLSTGRETDEKKSMARVRHQLGKARDQVQQRKPGELNVELGRNVLSRGDFLL